MDESNWKHKTVSIIPLSENTAFYLQYLWQTDSERNGMTQNGMKWDLPSESLNPPCLLKQEFETDFALIFSTSKVIVPMGSYRLSCSSVSYMNGRSETQASRWYYHRRFLEPSCKVQLSWGLIQFYIIVAKLITRTNKYLRSYYLMHFF